MQPELSIIIPVYNCEKYIIRCLGSILRQQDSDKYEIIVVNDGSTDNTANKLNKFAPKYKNIKVIHQKNAGVSVARNVGISASHGKYVTFVDGDDIVGINAKAFDKHLQDSKCNKKYDVMCVGTGDSSVYDAMVRLAQDFSVRYPLIDGQGNFGNIDGDPQAAYRYTESKMTQAAMLIMEGIDEDSVDMMPNFDGTTVEPTVMPGAFPNLLANGGMGIAVGMATNIPTHNVSEIMDALNLVVDKPDATTPQIMKKLIGPDFPTGGVLIDDFDTICKNYDTGRGAFRIRAKWEVEKLDRGAEQVVITEIPYGIIKSKLVEQIADLVDAKKLPLVEDIVDESTTDVRIVITPKSRNVPADKMMAHLFAMTDLEYKFNMNFNVVDSNGAPIAFPDILSLIFGISWLFPNVMRTFV